MKKVLAIIAAIMLLATGASPVMAADLKEEAGLKVGGKEEAGLKVGDKLVLSKDTVAEVISTGGYNNTYKLTIGDTYYLDDLITPVNCRWIYDAEKKQYVAGANYFEATVKDEKVTVTYKGKSIDWQPSITIGTKSVKAISPAATILNPVTGLYEDPINENYTGNTLYWQYPNGIVRSVRIIEGVITEYYTLYEPIKEDVTILSNETKDIGFDYTRPQMAWDNTERILKLDATKDKALDKALVLTAKELEGAEYPVTIDPDTSFTTSASDDSMYYDGDLYTSYSTAWGSSNGETTFARIGQRYTYVNVGTAQWDYEVYRYYSFFDTSSIPDGVTITDATLKIYVYSKGLSSSYDIVIQEGMPTYPHDPLEAGDFNKANYSGDGGSINSSSIILNQYNDIDLNATGKGWINDKGYTKLVLRSNQDISGTSPGEGTTSRNNYIGIRDYEYGIGYRPTLEITYTAETPTVRTDAASSVATTTARLNATIVDNGGDDCEVRWGYGTTSQASITAYDTSTAWGGTYTTGNKPYLDIDSLTANETYYFRVEARNSEGTDLGAEQSFTTESSVDDVTTFRAYPSANLVNLSWAKGAGASSTVIRYSYDTYPTSITEGTALYNGTDVNYQHTGLATGVTIFYSAWGLSGTEYSASYATAVTTTSGIVAGGSDLDMPIAPNRWMSDPDYTNLENIPFLYDAINDIADSINMPRATAWMGLVLLIAAGGAMLVYLKLKSALMGLAILLGVLLLGWVGMIVPFWMPLLALIILVGGFISRRELPV